MNTTDNDSSEKAPLATGGQDVLVCVDDYTFPKGWNLAVNVAARARHYCEQLEAGRVLYFCTTPYVLFKEDLEFLRSRRQTGSPLHKNVSYRPAPQDVLRGAAGSAGEMKRLQEIMRNYSEEVTRFVKQLLTPYAPDLVLDYASFRPEEEAGRRLPVHKRNDLLHVDAFPTRPMNGHRILRSFTNIHPTASRVWNTTDGFPVLAQKYAQAAGLAAIAAQGSQRSHPLVRSFKQALGLKAVDHSAYDRFMLRFHDYLKENSDFQQNCPKITLQFKPGWTWLCFTDSVPHAVLSGRYALEHTFVVPLPSLINPEKAPIRLLEKLADKPLSRAA